MRPSLLVVALALLFSPALRANPYDTLLSNSAWYVPAANLLAFVAPNTDLTETLAVGDQTIWTLDDCTSGVFTGTSVATFQIGPLVITSTTSMNGLVTDSGQMRIAFSTPNAPTIIGIGQIRDISGTSYVQMQMISDAGDSYLTHWAYMAPYEEGTTILPPLTPQSDFLCPEWAWLDGTTWALECPDLFTQPAQFLVEDYANGYFWGTGTSGSDSFSLLGSSTPEGNLFFNILLDGTLTSLTGQITGDGTAGAMVMHTYDEPDGFSVGGAAALVPEPSSVALLIAVLGATVLEKRRRRAN